MLFAMPFAWLAVVEQHSIWHAWFVSRIYFTSFALVIAGILALPRRAEEVGRSPISRSASAESGT